MTTDARDTLARRLADEPMTMDRNIPQWMAERLADVVLAWLAEPEQVERMAKAHRAEVVRETRDMTFGEIWDGRNRAMRAAVSALREPRT